MTASFLLLLLVAVLAARAAPTAPLPSDLVALECQMHLLAYDFGIARVGHIATAASALHDALNLAACSAEPPTQQRSPKRSAIHESSPVAGAANDAAPTFYVATDGSDANAGTSVSPFLTLERAQRAARAAKAPATVLLRGGRYYLNATLRLGAEDSGTTWAAVEGDAKPVVLSGGKLLDLEWTASSLRKGVLQAALPPALVDELMGSAEAAYWHRRRADTVTGTGTGAETGGGGHAWGPPPARWNTLHVGGVRQQRARFPNGNAQAPSGLCFSAVNRPGEGCPGYIMANGTGGIPTLPKSTKVATVASPLDRNQAPASPTTRSPSDNSTVGSCGTFSMNIYDPPTGHPVYRAPLPDSTWTNNSFVSFWSGKKKVVSSSLLRFSRPSSTALSYRPIFSYPPLPLLYPSIFCVSSPILSYALLALLSSSLSSPLFFASLTRITTRTQRPALLPTCLRAPLTLTPPARYPPHRPPRPPGWRADFSQRRGQDAELEESRHRRRTHVPCKRQPYCIPRYLLPRCASHTSHTASAARPPHNPCTRMCCPTRVEKVRGPKLTRVAPSPSSLPLQSGLWGGWQYQVSGRNGPTAETGETLQFGYGGFQGE